MGKLLLAIDDVSLPFRKNVGLYLTKPAVRQEPVLRPSPFGSGAPDDLAAYFYGTVLYDEGKYRMWYYASHWEKNPDWPPEKMKQVAKAPWWFHGESSHFKTFGGPLCYAESDDGTNWTKPALGQVLFKGTVDNNAIDLPHTSVSAAIVIKDMEDPDPNRRYKMTYQFFVDQCEEVIAEYGTWNSVALAVSPDGINWTMTAIPYKDQFLEPSSFTKFNGMYIIHYHVMGETEGYRSEGGHACGRTGVARVSPDFDFWPDVLVETFAPTEPEDPGKRGHDGTYDQVHLGVGAASFGNVCVGLYGLWHNADFNNAFDQISGDLGLLVSNDGIHFREPVKGYRFIHREDSLATPVPGYNFHTILCQANGILNVGDQTLIYHGRWRNAGGHEDDVDLNQYASSEVALATIPRDRWGAFGLNPDANDGTVCSAAIILPTDCALSLNADGIAGLKVKLLDKNFHTIPDYDIGVVVGSDGLDCPVEWAGKSLAELGGRTVRISMQMNRLGDDSPRLYALNITDKSAGRSK